MNLITDVSKYVRLTKGASPNITYEDVYDASVCSIETVTQGTGNTIVQDKVIIYTGNRTIVLETSAAPGWALSGAQTVALTATAVRDYLNTYFNN
jgi:hypothetical protein